MENTTAKPRPFEQQTALERTLRALLWMPQDKLNRAEESLVGHVKKQEYQQAANCQTAIIKATNESKTWEYILSLYEQERPQSQLASSDVQAGESRIRYELEGQHAQWPNDWSLLHGGGESEVEVRRAEWQFRDWSEIQPVKGWQDFRVVRVTTTREILLRPAKKQ